jgi:uncharacterized protein
MNDSASSRRSTLKFFILVFALAIPFWVIGAVTKQGLPLLANLPVSSLQAVCPLIAAFVLVYREDGLGGIRRLLTRVFDHKRIKPKIWYVPIIFLAPAIMLLSYWAMLLLGRPLPEPYIPIMAMPVLFIVFFVAAVCEESGWSGYAIDPMQCRWSALRAGIILGSVWAIWHVIPWLQANTPTWTAWQFLSTVALRILIVWLYNSTGKSVLSAVLFHDMFNVSEFLFPNYGSHYDPAVTGTITAIVAVIVTFLWGRKTLARYRYARSAT